MSKTTTTPRMADRADPHVLYQESVQCVEAEIDFVDETFQQLRRRKPRYLREDFCGTANTSCEWVRRRRDNVAVGVDLDPEVLDWGRRHNIPTLKGNGPRRIELLQRDVLKVKTRPMDLILAMNFSYWLFMQRKTLKRYFSKVREALVDDGIFFLDAYGGYDAPRVIREHTEHDGFTYIWDQAGFNPIDGRMQCHIHFKFEDGSWLRRAFSYEWRLWTLPELRELLDEAGFRNTTIYLQGTDEDTGEGNGIFEATEIGEPDAGWIAYIVAEK